MHVNNHTIKNLMQVLGGGGGVLQWLSCEPGRIGRTQEKKIDSHSKLNAPKKELTLEVNINETKILE